MSYLEEYIESIAATPIDVNRCVRLIREIDTRLSEVSARLEQLQHEYTQRTKNAKDKKAEAQKPENQKLLEEIRSLQEQGLAYSKSKVDISTQAFDVVQKSYYKLEGDLKKFEDTLKIQQEQQDYIQPEPVAPKDTKKIGKTGSKYAKSYKTKGSKASREQVQQVINPEPVLDTSTADKGEERYCICNGISFGDMIKCDNPFCEREWFHLTCMNITSVPKGKWFCKDCKKMKSSDSLKF